MSAVAVLTAAGLRGRRRGGLIATFLVVVLASVAIVAGLVVNSQGAGLLDAAAEDAAVAHLVAYGTPDALAEVEADAEVIASAGPFESLGGVELLLADEVVPIEVIARESPDGAVGRVPVDDGRWATAPDEIVFDRSLAVDLGIGIGDTVVMRVLDRSLELTVVGTGINFTDCFYPQCEPGRTWMTGEGLERLGGDERYSQVYLRFEEAGQAEPFVERVAAAGVAGISGSNSWLDTRSDFLVLDRIFGAFVAAFGGFVLVISSVIVAGSTAMRVVTRRRDVGLLGALGATPRQIGAALVIENLLIGLVAAVVGWVLAGFLASSLQLGISRTLGPQSATWPLFSLVICVVVVSALLILATLASARSAARRPVTDVLRNAPATNVSAINRRTARVPPRLVLMGAQEVASRPARSALAALAVAVAVVGSLVSLGFVAGLDRVTSDAELAGDPWDVAIVAPGVDAATVEEAILAADGVERWFSDVERKSTFRNGVFLAVATGGDPADAAYVVVDGRGVQRPGEAIVGYGFLQRFDVNVGDRIEFMAGTAPIDVTIVGWYRDTEDSGVIMRFRIEDLAAVEPGVQPDVYRLAVAESVDPAGVGETLSAELGPSARFQVLDTGRADIEPVFVVLRLVAGVLLLTASVHLFSTLATTARESSALIGVRLSIGFTPRQLVADGAIGGAVLGVIAVVVGVPVGFLTFRLLADAVGRGIGVGPGWMSLPGPLATALIAVGAIALSSALGGLSVRRLANQPASDLVRAE